MTWIEFEVKYGSKYTDIHLPEQQYNYDRSSSLPGGCRNHL